MPILNAMHLATELQGAGLMTRKEREDLPTFLHSDKDWEILWAEVERLIEQLGRQSLSLRTAALAEMAKCTLSPGRDHAFWPCNDVYVADEATAILFARILPPVPFVNHGTTAFRSLWTLCPTLDALAAIGEMEEVEDTQLRSALERDAPLARDLLGWFEDHRAEVLRNSNLRASLAALPIFPASTGFEPLTELALPGGFDDPLGIAGILKVDALAGRLDFLRELGAKELTFETYARTHIPNAVNRADLPDACRRQLIQLLARRNSELRDSADVRTVLAELPLVECQDHLFRSATDVYFDIPVVIDVLGDIPLAKLPREHAEGVRELYKWLGVAEEPRLDAVYQRIEEATSDKPNEERIATVQRLFEHLATRVTIDDNVQAVRLKFLAWLPAQGDDTQWYRPDALYAVFRRSLFESQARFLDVPQRVQQYHATFLKALGIRSNPTGEQVVAHLLHRSARGEPVGEDIYQFLADEAAPQTLLRLHEESCIHLGDGKFVRPDQVYWQHHPFGMYRWQLADSLRRYNELFTRLGVREAASHRDAIQVLYELEADFGASNRFLDDEAKAVVAGCWRLLSTEIQLNSLDPDELASLEHRKVICAPNGVLQIPNWMFFEDRPRLAAKFGGFLVNNAFTKPEGQWQAMQAAGVRNLSQAVQTRLVERDGANEDNEVLSRIQERQDLLRRLLDFASPGLGAKLGIFSEVRCYRATRLVVAQTLDAFNRVRQSIPESVQAYLSQEDRELYFAASDGRLPWIAISRELVSLLCPDEQPGQLAIGMKDILGSESEEIAKSVLDELQIPELDVQTTEGLLTSSVISSLGDEVENVVEDIPPADNGDGSIEPMLDVTERHNGGDHGHSTAGPAGQDLGGAASTTRRRSRGGDRKLSDGQGNGTPAKGGDEEDSDSEGNGTTRRPGGPAGNRGARKRRGYAVLRSYVMPDRPDDDGALDGEGQSHRTEVGQKGVDRVMRFEEERGRHPKEMPPRHEGYDIESNNDDANIERIIEVKSLDGEWTEAEAGLTKPQVEKARQLRHQYWLYVVEYALDDERFRIHAIQDPYGKANRFMFDPGWCQVEELRGGTPQRRVDAHPF